MGESAFQTAKYTKHTKMSFNRIRLRPTSARQGEHKEMETLILSNLR